MTRLYKHGEYVNPLYVSATRLAEHSTDAARPDGKASGVVKRYKKSEQVSNKPMAMGWITQVYDDAIEYAAEGGARMRGVRLLWGLFGGSGGILFGWLYGQDYLSDDWFFKYTAIAVAIIFPLVSFYIILTAFRGELFTLQSEPILFDRRHRKVWRIFREVQPGMAGLFKPWPVRICEYDWDLIDAEHDARIAPSGGAATRYHALFFLVRKSASDSTIIDVFAIGDRYTMVLDESVNAVWEHIRRFMQNKGQALPHGEPVTSTQVPRTLWQSLGTVGPFGPGYLTWWRDEPAVMILFHVLSPFFVPLFLLWGLLNWLSFVTAIKVDWPEEVKAQIGESAVCGEWVS
jgi:hypothetical protein